jgi:hypothetical protein
VKGISSRLHSINIQQVVRDEGRVEAFAEVQHKAVVSWQHSVGHTLCTMRVALERQRNGQGGLMGNRSGKHPRRSGVHPHGNMIGVWYTFSRKIRLSCGKRV